MSYPNSLRRPNPLIIIINDLPPIPPTEIRRPTQQQLRNMAQVMAIPQPERKFRSYMRRVPLFGPMTSVAMIALEWFYWQSKREVTNLHGWVKVAECPQGSGGNPTYATFYGTPVGTSTRRNINNCLGGQVITSFLDKPWPMTEHTSPVRGIVVVAHTHDSAGSARGRYILGYSRDSSTTVMPQEGVEVVPRYAPLLNPQPSPYATYYPPLANPPALAPPLRYGYGGERKTPLLPEDSEAGYHNEAIHQRTEPNPPWLMSEPPPAGTKEKKMRMTNSALGALVHRVVGGSTEGLDYAWAFFNSLPMYLRYKAFNYFRRLEVRGNDGFIKEARLHYVALTPQEMIKWTLDHIDEMDPTTLLTNILAMQGSDRAWAAIGRAMGRYARGPWDQPLPGGPNATDWAPFIEFVTENYLHNEELLNDLARQYNLTREEMRIINNRFRQYREQNPGYEPPITL